MTVGHGKTDATVIATTTPPTAKPLRSGIFPKGDEPIPVAVETRPQSKVGPYRTSPLPMWVFDRGTGAIVAINGAAMHEYGYSSQNVCGLNVRHLWPPHEAERLLVMPLCDEVSWMGPWVHYRRNGSSFDAEIAAIALGGPGAPAAMVLVRI